MTTPGILRHCLCENLLEGRASALPLGQEARDHEDVRGPRVGYTGPLLGGDVPFAAQTLPQSDMRHFHLALLAQIDVPGIQPPKEDPMIVGCGGEVCQLDAELGEEVEIAPSWQRKEVLWSDP